MMRRWCHLGVAALWLSSGCFSTKQRDPEPSCDAGTCPDDDGSGFDAAVAPGDAAPPDEAMPMVPPGCGNGIIDFAETCDGEAFSRPRSCASVFGVGVPGEVGCTSACTIDISPCGAVDAGRDPTCIEQASQATPGSFGALNDACQQCVCNRCHRAFVSSCDDDCWRLLECTVSACVGVTGNARTTCMQESCGDLLGEVVQFEASPLLDCAYTGASNDCTDLCYAIDYFDAG